MPYPTTLAAAATAALAAATFSLAGTAAAATAAPGTGKPATDATARANAAVLQQLPFQDQRDFDAARRGFIGTLDHTEIRDAKGNVVWSLEPYEFLKPETAPATVNPSLWRQARLNLHHGLFQVTDRIYQVRGFDIANMTIIEGESGLIVIDPLTAAETSRAGLDLYFRHRPKKPVVAVIYTHSHGDHFGGVKGVISEDDVKAGRVRVLAPEGFMEEAVSENVFAGNAMSRRAQYMYGFNLPRSATGQVDVGLGKAVAHGTLTLIPPTDLIHKTGDTRTIDGVQIEFLMAPGTEAPAEMLMYFPQWQALCAAEDATHNLHNLYTIRGAQVRDANQWWRALDETIDRFGARTEVLFAQHHWPTWGRQEIVTYLGKQRDGYKYIHDQSLRLANLGYVPAEIAERVKLPPSLASEWHLRDYYGTVSHNAKAVYQRYLGWYDANPANLNPLPPEEAGKRYVEFMGGAARVLEQARAAYARGEYRWVAEVVKHVVFADPSNQAARQLEADALEQLGYQAESSTWRNAYLSGAAELRAGPPKTGRRAGSPDVLRAMTDTMFLDYLAISLNGDRAAGKTLALNWVQPDTGKRFALTVENGVFRYKPDAQHAAPQATLTMPRAVLMGVLAGQTTLQAETQAGRARVEGDPQALAAWAVLMDKSEPNFAIVTP
ncbi:putative enzyme with 2 metallo-hydrolase/oxidoreductase domains, 2 TPR-like domains, sterol carrier protein domain; similar to E.coli yjcS, annotated putative alkyl sulfatase [Cupriavidus taiwanensis]|uniref:alkyl/aryl-sulfatase n=1 Tax=Cupriavidus taiwanensis TaxID=164546 RepID=UPI000E178C37|nr:alkyl sulfatase dimerization domain-containing protein [Cupriavidus taiwanensis]SOZ97343.1 putative enzyme with 2 metallo-hydrolase/oxidoreductase domains, 2 TPR-like domains, sterol carrier protein domain; similar to E.coli yjcS, annotated putative alkyl sulfatase [Cupriavidus taiwanensis]